MYNAITNSIANHRATGPPALRHGTLSDVPLAIALNIQSHFHRGLAADPDELGLFISRLTPSAIEGLLEIFNSTLISDQSLESFQSLLDSALAHSVSEVGPQHPCA